MIVKAVEQPMSLRRIRYEAAFGTAVQLRDTALDPAEAVTAGAGRAGQVELFWFDGSDAPPQAMACRLNAAKMAAACGVPLARLPSSSSMVRNLVNQEPAL